MKQRTHACTLAREGASAYSLAGCGGCGGGSHWGEDRRWYALWHGRESDGSFSGGRENSETVAKQKQQPSASLV